MISELPCQSTSIMCTLGETQPRGGSSGIFNTAERLLAAWHQPIRCREGSSPRPNEWLVGCSRHRLGSLVRVSGGILGSWAHWGIFRRSSAFEKWRKAPWYRRYAGVIVAVPVMGGWAAALLTTTFGLAMAIYIGAALLLLLMLIPVYAWRVKHGLTETSRPRRSERHAPNSRSR